MNKLEEINIKIDANKELIGTLPKNNEKNIKSYLKKLEEFTEEFKEYEKQILSEMEIRLEKISTTKENEELVEIKKGIEKIEKIMYLLNSIQTSYEKMELDRAIHNLRYYYKKNLEVVNETIIFCLRKFKEVGICLKIDDFCYSKFVRDYMEVILAELEKEEFDLKRMQTKFEEIYWVCPNIIIYIELNMRYLYFKNEKIIDKYYVKKKEMLLQKLEIKDITDRHIELQRQLIEKTNEDKATIIRNFMDGKLNIKEYSLDTIESSYSKFISEEILENADETTMDEIDINMMQLLNSVYEYKNYLKYKFIVDDIKKIYAEKDKFEKAFTQVKNEIAKKEKKLIKLNNKSTKKCLFRKPEEKLFNQQDSLILETKELYRELDKNKVYCKVATELNEHSTIYDALYLASSFHNYLFRCISDYDKEMQEDEVDKLIEEIQTYVKWPYITIINNISLQEERDILLTIKDRYKLLNINLEKEDLELDNMENLMEMIQRIEVNHNIKKNNIDTEELMYIMDFRKIVNK